MYIQQFAPRNTNVRPSAFMYWDGVSIEDLRQFNEVFRPPTPTNPSWTIETPGNSEVYFYKDGVVFMTIVPGCWLKLEPWPGNGSPPVYSDYNLQTSWMRFGGPEGVR